MEGTLGPFGSRVCQELEAKKRQENKTKRKRSHAGWTAMFPHLLLFTVLLYIGSSESVFREEVVSAAFQFILVM